MMALFDPDTLQAAQRQGADPLGLFRDAMAQANEALRRRFHEGAPASELVHERAQMVDQLLQRAWECLAPARAGNGAQEPALVAVGGYGRGELHPGSDIDLLILLPQDDHTPYQDRIERFIVFLWDMGLEVGHSVRSVAECIQQAQADITVTTNLMEARLLDGPHSLFEEMRASVGPERIWPSRQFFEAKWQEQIARHHRFHDTAYNLEPNIKEGPGGLRDLHMIGWVAKRHFGADTLYDLVGHGFLTEAEHATLVDNQEFLWRIRLALHHLTNRREDRLLFDYQQTLAQQFGYRDNIRQLAVEQFMKQYYRSAGELTRLNEMLLQLFQEAILYADEPAKPVPISKRFQARKGFIEVIDENVFKRYPFALLEIFLVLEQHPELKGVRAETIRLIRDHRYLIDDGFRNDIRARSLFMEIMRQPQGITHELRRMNSYGILGAYMPVFGNVVGQMQYDLFHVYTVDQHTLFVVRNIRRLAVPEFRHEFPLCSAIFQRLPKPEILYLAGLFHDIAKGRGGDHSILGAQDAKAFCLHHGMSDYDARVVEWLVKNHLIMSRASQREDISDPDVVNTFAEKVGDQARLDYLYLLTVADMRGTGPDVWNSWKAALLTELYTATQRALRRGLGISITQKDRILETQEQAYDHLKEAGFEDRNIGQLWSDMSDDYFLRYSPDEIVWHAQAILPSPVANLPLILIREPKSRGGTEIFIYTRARDHLFALITAVLDQLGLTVADARIIGSRSGFTLDTYIVLESSGEPIRNAHRIQEIESQLRAQLERGDTAVARVSRQAPRQLKHFKISPEISFSLDHRHHRTVMEVIAHDRPGLLAKIGKALQSHNVVLHNAKITTFGARAEDLFYLTDSRLRPLNDTAREHLRISVAEALEE